MSRPGGTRFAHFDSLRALAALAVVVFHTAALSHVLLESRHALLASHLNVGVALFFAISGFLLYHPFARALLHGTEPPRLPMYARRRFLRIVPAYWLALTALGLWPGLPGVFTTDWWVFYGLLQSNRLEWVFGGINPAWSLSVEVAYYALLPLLAAGIARYAAGAAPERRMRRALLALAALGAASLGFRIVSRSTGAVGLISALPAFGLWFAVGMAFALARVSGGDRPRALRFVIERPSACWALAAALYVGFCFWPGAPTPLSVRTAGWDAVEHGLYATISALVMAPAVFGERAGGLPRRILASPVLTQVGVVSYGIFLWHHPLLLGLPHLGLDRLVAGSRFLSMLLVILPLAVACGWLSHRLVEQPALRLGRGAS